MEPNRIAPFEVQVVQAALPDIDPRVQLQVSLQRLAEHRLEREAWAQRVHDQVDRERAEAVARGVQVVVDDTLPDSYLTAMIYD